jgi:integrase
MKEKTLREVRQGRELFVDHHDPDGNMPMSLPSVVYSRRIWPPGRQTRHTTATMWLAPGENPEWVARQLGHANVEMLFKVLHLLMRKETVEEIAGEYLSGREPVESPLEGIEGYARLSNGNNHS